MDTFSVCEWCKRLQKITPGQPNFCVACSHRSDRPKAECDCLMCQPLDALLLAMPEVPAPAVGPDDIVYTLEGGVHYPPRKLREHPPGDLQVDGRFFKAPVVQVTVLESRVVIRLDDEQQPEQWVELVISEELLNLWVRNQRDAQEAEDDSTADFE